MALTGEVDGTLLVKDGEVDDGLVVLGVLVEGVVNEVIDEVVKV